MHQNAGKLLLFLHFHYEFLQCCMNQLLDEDKFNEEDLKKYIYFNNIQGVFETHVHIKIQFMMSKNVGQ